MPYGLLDGLGRGAFYVDHLLEFLEGTQQTVRKDPLKLLTVALRAARDSEVGVL